MEDWGAVEHFRITKGDGGWCNCGKRYPCGANHSDGWRERVVRLERLCELPAKDVPCQDDIRAALERVEEQDRQLREAHERIMYLSGKLMEAEREGR